MQLFCFHALLLPCHGIKEKWDSMTRRWQDKPGMYKQIRLLLIDEVIVLQQCISSTVLLTACF